MTKIRIAHLSDPHFTKLSWNPKHWLSKRLLSQLNCLLNPSRQFEYKAVEALPDFVHSLHANWVMMTGDFTSSGTEGENQLALQWIEKFMALGMSVLTLPGNHDHYAERRHDRGFHAILGGLHLPSQARQPSDFFHSGLTTVKLGKNWSWVGLDVSPPMPWISSQGLFSAALQKELTAQLSTLSKQEHVLVGAHFPIHNRLSRRKGLLRAKDLAAVLKKFEGVKLYAHGHTHEWHLIDERHAGLPVTVDAGSCSHPRHPTFALLDLYDDHMEIVHYVWSAAEGWHSGQTMRFTVKK